MLGVVALVAYAVSGCPVTVPGWCSCGVSLFLANGAVYRGCACALVCARLALRAVACACCAPCLCACCRAPCFGWGVLLRSSQCVRAAVCLSVAACGGARCWFVAVYFGCRLLCGVRFVSAPAPTVTWFMLVCVGVHLTATVVVAYRLPCNGRFQRLSLSTSMPVVFVSVSYRHKGAVGRERRAWSVAAGGATNNMKEKCS